MIGRKNFDISAYFVVGPENTEGRPLAQVVKAALAGGMTCLQIRSKVASAVELIQLTEDVAKVIAETGKSNDVALLVDDRLDVVLAAIKRGIKVDGIHVGQTDIPVDVCRDYLGEDAIIGLSARPDALIEYVQTVAAEPIDYFGAGPLRETATKPDCGVDARGHLIERSFSELRELAQVSPLPIVVGGGVKLTDLPELAQTGVDGFFVVSTIASAKEPGKAAADLVKTWQDHRPVKNKS